MDKTNKLITGISVLAMFVIWFILPKWGEEYSGCAEYEKMYKEKINSVVINKFIDERNHHNETIVYFTEKGRRKNKVLLNEYGNLYGIISIGDTLIKEPKRDIYLVKNREKNVEVKFENFCKKELDLK